MTEAPIHPATVIGHVHLKVSDLARAVQFYTEVMGFELMTRMGDGAAFLSAAREPAAERRLLLKGHAFPCAGTARRGSARVRLPRVIC